MEIQDEKVYKTKKTVREAMKRYMENMKENKQEQYMKKTEYHKAYNKYYYTKIQEESTIEATTTTIRIKNTKLIFKKYIVIFIN